MWPFKSRRRTISEVTTDVLIRVLRGPGWIDMAAEAVVKKLVEDMTGFVGAKEGTIWLVRDADSQIRFKIKTDKGWERCNALGTLLRDV